MPPEILICAAVAGLLFTFKGPLQSGGGSKKEMHVSREEIEMIKQMRGR